MKFLRRLIGILSILLVTLVLVTFIVIKIKENKVKVISVDSIVKKIASRELSTSADMVLENIVVDEDKNVVIEDSDNTVLDDDNLNSEVFEKVIYNDVEDTNIIDEQNISDVLETQIGKMSGYGPDCYGCSGYLASGKYVGDGTIYYDDATYGKVRIVAGDSKYEFGTIIRVQNSRIGSFLAIVLDRGGAIGFGKQFLFDLLYSSEQAALVDEVSYNVTFEVLRYGY